MRNLRKSLVALLVTLAAASVPAMAQRQTVGRPAVDASVLFGRTNGSAFTFTGASVGWVSHLNRGQILRGLMVSEKPCEYHYVVEEEYDSSGNLVNPGIDDLHEFDVCDIQAGLGYHVRLLAPRSRVVILSAGAGLYAGVRYGKEVTAFPKDSDKPDGPRLKSVGFVVTLVPEVKLEAFPLRNASVYLSCRPSLELLSGYGGKCSWIIPYAALGVKYYL